MKEYQKLHLSGNPYSFHTLSLKNFVNPSTDVSSIIAPITTFKNHTSLTFHFYFSGFTYRSFSANLFTTSSTTLSYSFFFSVPTITLLII